MKDVLYKADHGAPAPAQDVDYMGQTAVMHAVAHVGTVQLLLQSGAAVDVVDKNGWSALFHAAVHNHTSRARSAVGRERGSEIVATSSD